MRVRVCNKPFFLNYLGTSKGTWYISTKKVSNVKSTYHECFILWQKSVNSIIFPLIYFKHFSLVFLLDVEVSQIHEFACNIGFVTSDTCQDKISINVEKISYCVRASRIKEIQIILRLFLVMAMYCKASSSQFNQSLNLSGC